MPTNVEIPDTLDEQIAKVAEQEGYSSKSEVVREAVRNRVQERRNEDFGSELRIGVNQIIDSQCARLVLRMGELKVEDLAPYFHDLAETVAAVNELDSGRLQKIREKANYNFIDPQETEELENGVLKPLVIIGVLEQDAASYSISSKWRNG